MWPESPGQWSPLYQAKLIKAHKNFHVKPLGLNVWGKIEVKEIMEATKLAVEGEEGDERKIFCEQPHSTWDNKFSGYQIMNWIGGNGFVDMIMFRGDWLQGDIEGK